MFFISLLTCATYEPMYFSAEKAEVLSLLVFILLATASATLHSICLGFNTVLFFYLCCKVFGTETILLLEYIYAVIM